MGWYELNPDSFYLLQEYKVCRLLYCFHCTLLRHSDLYQSIQAWFTFGLSFVALLFMQMQHKEMGFVLTDIHTSTMRIATNIFCFMYYSYFN